MRKLTILLSLIVLTACSGPKDTPLPRELDKMDTIKPAMEKLTAEERELALSYIMRHTITAKIGGLFGGKEGPGIPEGMTLGKAIEEQRKFKADAAIEEAKQQALKAKLKAEREEAQKQMREAITVTLISKKISEERGYSGIVTDENLRVVFGYKNNTDKEVAGVKGYVSIKDLFGEEISGFLISNDTTIPPGQSITWTGSRSVKYSTGRSDDRKLAELPEEKYKVVWEPEMIVFKDGTKLTGPKE
ncbi:DUF4398 domain-containing protein [Undibacterium luofuense]|uniref:Lipoprotein n=1 Tax=Undibacterium luofuense TaxID=2828733 RepID=A0A941DJH0_9BURK|nr:DUF4398 domain-containing protein [Undibacterium luofuense]MBR7780712.1 hypothetical protein [Undibacterium luofuense]